MFAFLEIMCYTHCIIKLGLVYMYCCFTGHRPQGLPWGNNESDMRCTRFKTILKDLIEEAVLDGYYDFYCGMALGVDTYAAEIILDMQKKYKDIKLHAAIPCPCQDKGWSEPEKNRYRKILKHCNSKTIISPFYSSSCMLMRNRFMIDNSDRLIAAWNGSPRGGTAFTIRYAKNNMKEIHLIRTEDLSVTSF